VNAEKIQLTGSKMETKLYIHHSGYPGGMKTATAQHLFRKDPTQLLVQAIEGMLPKNPLGNHMAKKLRVYVGPNHPHQAQQPQPLRRPQNRLKRQSPQKQLSRRPTKLAALSSFR